MTGKYPNGDRCDWCGAQPAKEIIVQTNGVKTKRYSVTAMACDECARRVIDDGE